MDLLFLGTGAGVPSKLRNVTSICLRLIQEQQCVWMFDCGEGTQHQVLHYPIKLRQLEKLFVTHLHGDHVFGIPGLLGTRSSQGATTPLTIYGPEGIARFVETALDISQSHLTYDVTVHEIKEPGHVVTDGDFTVYCDFLAHNIPSLGYRITEQPKTGKLDVEALRRLGVPAGPLYGELKAGRDVSLTDGTCIRATDVLSPPIPGRIVTILGDTKPTGQSISLAKEATMLVHEATFGSDSAKLAPKYGHSTAADAARIASSAQASALVLTHISQRYTAESAEQLLEEARAYFDSVVLAKDGSSIEIPTPVPT